jgi:glycerophosphoryl diester phosphodiesterase
MSHRRLPVRWLSAALFLVALGPGSALAQEAWALDVQGHGRCRGLRPENTMAAFEHAIARRVTTLELDVQVTLDRVVIVSHGPRVDADLCRLPDDRIPTLEDVLELALVAEHPVRLSIEVKEQVPRETMTVAELARLVVQQVVEHELAHRTTIQSFHPEALVAAREVSPDVPTAILLKTQRDADRLIASSGADTVSARLDALDADDVKRFQDRGLRVVPWGAASDGQLRRLVELGVEGAITDYPNRLISVLEEMGWRAADPTDPTLRRGHALRLEDVRTVAVLPFTSRGLIDTYGTSLFQQELKRRRVPLAIIDPHGLGLPFRDGSHFHAAGQMPALLAKAKAAGADAVFVGVGHWYHGELRFRAELRLIEVNEARTLWSSTAASGFGWTGPAMKKRVMRRLLAGFRGSRS